MISMLLAYDADGNVIATLDHLVLSDENGVPHGLVDFGAAEAAGIPLRNIWNVEGAAGSGTWPEWLGQRAHEFRVRRRAYGDKTMIAQLVHRESGEVHDRKQVEARIAERIREAGDQPADLRDIVGGPGRPLQLDSNGRSVGRAAVPPLELPLIGKKD